jgi:hypothetical protein
MDSFSSMITNKSTIRRLNLLAIVPVLLAFSLTARAQNAAPTPVNQAPPAGDGSIRAYAVPPGSIDEVLRKLGERYPASSGVRFIHDARTSQILAFGPPATPGQHPSRYGGPNRCPRSRNSTSTRGGG